MPSENIHIVLRSQVFVWVRVIHALSEQIVYQNDSEQIEVIEIMKKSC